MHLLDKEASLSVVLHINLSTSIIQGFRDRFKMIVSIHNINSLERLFLSILPQIFFPPFYLFLFALIQKNSVTYFLH